MAKVTFCDVSGDTVQIFEKDLEQYPGSFLTMMAFTMMSGNKTNGMIRVAFLGPTLRMVAEFYTNGIWRNPYIRTNRLEMEGIEGNFDEHCEFLGLPCEPIDDGDDLFYDEDVWDDATLEDDLTYEEYKEIQAIEKAEYEAMLAYDSD